MKKALALKVKTIVNHWKKSSLVVRESFVIYLAEMVYYCNGSPRDIAKTIKYARQQFRLEPSKGKSK